MPTTVVITIAGYAITTGAIAVAVAATFAISWVATRIFGIKPPNITDNGVRQQIPPAPINSLPIVYGDAYLGGTFVDAVLSLNQKAMYYCLAVSSISPNGQFTFDQTKMYYGDRLITFDVTDGTRVVSLTDGSGNVDTKVNGHLYIALYKSDESGNITSLTNNGTMPWDIFSSTRAVDPIDPSLIWTTTNRRMNGLAFAVVTLGYDTDAGTTQLQPITFYCSHYLNNEGCAKPGDVWYDYMTNTEYGGAVDTDLIDSSSATALNTYSDELITFTNNEGQPSTQPRYRINGVIDTGKSILDNVDQILISSDSWMAYNAANGKWSIVINKAESSAMNFNDSNIIGDIRVNCTDINQSINQIEAKFPNKLNRDVQDYVFLKTPTILLYPNEPVNKFTTTYELVNDSVQAQYLANRQLEQAREDLIVSFKTTYEGIQINAGDVVSVTNAAYGWSSKLFRVVKVNEASLPDGGLGASLEMYEYNSQVYDDKDITEFSPSPNSGLPAPNYFSSLTTPTISASRPSAAIPSFDVLTTIPATGRVTIIQLYYTTVATPDENDWHLLNTASLSNNAVYTNGSTYTFLNNVLPVGVYYFAYKVGNNIGFSTLSTKSTSFSWNPQVTAASSFIVTFNPATLQVPYTSSPDFANAYTYLSGTTFQGQVQFVNAQTDSDVSFANNTWRIGASDTTGYADIVETNIAIPNPTVSGLDAYFGIPTSMSGTAQMLVPVRYKDPDGNIVQAASGSIQYTFAYQGDSGDKYSSANLYQWSTSTPSNPSGQSTYTWATGTNSSYTGSGGWSVNVPANPGIPLIQLYVATKQITATGTEATTTVSWASGYQIHAISQNGADGVQTAQPTVYKWAITIPSGPTGTSTYTWATGTFTAPSGWSLTAGTSPSPGYTLWGARVQLVDSATVTSSTINWTTASISAMGYAGSDGATGPTGTTGASARICYTKTTLSSLSSTPSTITTSGSASFPPNDSWGTGTVWQATPPSIVAGESVYQSDGIYSPTTGNTVWNVPYLSALKVGQLSAISANLGTMTAGTITAGMIQSGTTGTYNNGVWSLGSTISFQGFYSTLATNNSTDGYYSGIFIHNSTTGSNSVGLGAATKSGSSPAFAAANYNGSAGTSSASIGICYGAAAFSANYDGTTGTDKSWSQGAISNAGLYGTSIGSYTFASGKHLSDGYVGLSGAGGYFRFYNTDGLTYKTLVVCADTNYSVYSPSGGGKIYIVDGNGPFTGFHNGLIPIDTNPEIGDILYNTDIYSKPDVNNIVCYVNVSNQSNQKSVLGICSEVFNETPPVSWLTPVPVPAPNPIAPQGSDSAEITTSNNSSTVQQSLVPDGYKVVYINAVGEGQINVCGLGGNIEIGDLIVTSTIPGKGMKQSDDIVRTISVAKAMENVTFDTPEQVKMIACIYISG